MLPVNTSTAKLADDRVRACHVKVESGLLGSGYSVAIGSQPIDQLDRTGSCGCVLQCDRKDGLDVVAPRGWRTCR